MTPSDNPEGLVSERDPLNDSERSELEALRRWKREAIIVLDRWDDVWVAAGRPGPLAVSRAAAVERVLGDLFEYMNRRHQ